MYLEHTCQLSRKPVRLTVFALNVTVSRQISEISRIFFIINENIRKKIIYETKFPYFAKMRHIIYVDVFHGLRDFAVLSHNNVSRHRTIQGLAAISAVASDVGAVDSSS